MEKKKPAKHENTAARKRQIELLDRLLAQTRAQVREERQKGPAFEAELTARLEKAQTALVAVRKKLTTAKGQVKKRKREIDTWKLWYQGLPQLNKTAELSQLNTEIAWRAAEIAAKEAEISTLYLELLTGEGACEQIKIQLEAIRASTPELPLDHDLRIRSLLEERAQLQG